MRRLLYLFIFFFATMGWVLVMLPMSAQISVPPQTKTVERQEFNLKSTDFDLSTAGPVMQANVEQHKPFTVAGEMGLIVGEQNGSLEAWVLPVKLLSNLRIVAHIDGYNVPVDVNEQASTIEVRPDRTTIIYRHIGFTVRQILFSPSTTVELGEAAGVGGHESRTPTTGPVVIFEFEVLKPTEFVFSFTPEMRWMWPRANYGTPSAEWVTPTGSIGSGGLSAGQNFRQANADTAAAALGGFYLLHTDTPEFVGAVALPGATPGVMAPYQERPQVHPVEFHLRVDPKRDAGKVFPLLLAVGTTKEDTSSAVLGARLARLEAGLPALYKAHAAAWKERLAKLTKIETPDPELNEAFEWAEISVEQLRTHAFTAANNGAGETGLVAGYFQSADSARPGFGWFFGRDALYTLYATDSMGDFKLTRAELEFLIARQRADGKIMHEYSQTAPMIDWNGFPYEYAAADSTPLFLLASEDYVRTSGDVEYLRANVAAINKAWEFERTHDTDGDGIYDNSQGTGWVESWPTGMPHQEIYLALLDEQASIAYARMMELLKFGDFAVGGRYRAAQIHKTIEREYYDKEKGCYAFSYNGAKGVDRTRTVYPSLAWWSDWSGAAKDSEEAKALGLEHGSECLKQFAGHALDTDWGLRDVANDEPIYDGMSYHQGSVWPLFTGWASLAEYRGRQPIAGFELLMQNARLTREQDLGAVTELLSGDFPVPFGRSTSHQLWSSAMVITPTLRGLFGIDVDAATKTVTVNPQLPEGWKQAEIRDLQLPTGAVTITVSREGGKTVVTALGLKDGWIVKVD